MASAFTAGPSSGRFSPLVTTLSPESPPCQPSPPLLGGPPYHHHSHHSAPCIIVLRTVPHLTGQGRSPLFGGPWSLVQRCSSGVYRRKSSRDADLTSTVTAFPTLCPRLAGPWFHHRPACPARLLWAFSEPVQQLHVHRQGICPGALRPWPAARPSAFLGKWVEGSPRFGERLDPLPAHPGLGSRCLSSYFLF